MNTYDAFPKALCLYTCQGIFMISMHIQPSEVDCMKIVHEHTSNIDPVIGAFLLQVVLFYRQWMSCISLFQKIHQGASLFAFWSLGPSTGTMFAQWWQPRTLEDLKTTSNTWERHFLGESFHLAASFWNGLFCSPFSWSVFFDIQVWHFNQYRSESKLNWDGGILIAIGTYATLLSRLYHLILHKCLPLMHMHSICTQCFCCRSKLRYSDPWMQSTGRLFTRHDVSLPAPSHLVDRGVVGVISMLLSSFPPTWKSYGQGWSTECCWYNV